MVEFNELEALIKSNIDDAEVKINDLTGTSDHLGVLVISDHFKDKMLIEQHQMIMDILKEKLKSDLHAVQIKTMTFQKAQEQGFLT